MLMRFFKDRAGSIGVIFGLMAIPITLATGFAIDLSRLSVARSGVQGIVDRAAVAAATLNQSTSSSDDEAAKTAAKQYLNSSDFSKYAATVQSIDVSLPASDTVRVKVTGRIGITIMAISGTETVDFDVTADAIRGMNGTLEIVLALDTTNSMGGTKITTLKSAAGDLLDSLKAQSGADIKVGLVPFATYVNVGLSRRNEPWITVAADSSTKAFSCKTVDDTSSPSCVKTTSTCLNDGVPATCTKTTGCAKVEKCQDWTTTTKWSGCVGSRSYPFNTNVEGLPANKYTGIMNTSCSAEIVPLNTNVSSVKSAVNSMTVSSETYLPAGLIWAFNLLTPGGPASTAAAWDPNSLNRKPRKAIVLMTDGENTRSQSGVFHSGSDKNLANQYTSEICSNAKTKNIEIFTVAFQVTDANTKSLLQKCATDVSYYYDAADPSALKLAFQKIGTDLLTMRLAK